MGSFGVFIALFEQVQCEVLQCQVLLGAAEDVADAGLDEILLVLAGIALGRIVIGDGIRGHGIDARMFVKMLDGLEVMVTGFFAVIAHIDIVFAHEIVILVHLWVNHTDGFPEMMVRYMAVSWPVNLVITIVGPVGIDDAVGSVVLESGLLIETVCGERIHQRGGFAIETADG